MGKIIHSTLNVNSEMSEEERTELEALKDKPIIYDEDCPKLTEEQLSQFHHVKKDIAVQKVKKSSELRRQYMSYEMDRLRYGKQEKAKGKEEGRAEGRFEQLIELVKDETITVEKASEKAKMSVEEFVKKMEEIEAE